MTGDGHLDRAIEALNQARGLFGRAGVWTRRAVLDTESAQAILDLVGIPTGSTEVIDELRAIASRLERDAEMAQRAIDWLRGPNA